MSAAGQGGASSKAFCHDRPARAIAACRLTVPCGRADNPRDFAGVCVVKKLALGLAIAALPIALAIAQSMAVASLDEQLRYLFPDAVSFSDKEGSPPVYRAYGPAASGQEPPLLGLAFWTTELDPLERAYDGPIKMLVGMNTGGLITRIIVTDHREPYGYFSVDLPEFAEQFDDKDIRDRFRYGEDIDAISRATVSVTSASRAIRNSARRAATAHLAPPAQ
jgi:transcriptional regulator of nitric oxide reductase